ncbi:uncharacterized protein [Miscanthus floridulus]|uniref:uncharacterized protein n=1 Tax=Miscanthus floridulus TaxID=154761 RepID=UPI0034575467
MAAACREVPRPARATQEKLKSVVVHPARLSVEPDADGFRKVESRRRWRRAAPASRARPVPHHLVGLCFNCLGKDHVRVNCTFPSRCFSCLQEGHQARDCPRAIHTDSWAGKRGRSPSRARGRGDVARRHRHSPTSRRHASVPRTDRASSGAPELSSPEQTRRQSPPACEPQDSHPQVQAASGGDETRLAGGGDAPSAPVAGLDHVEHIPPPRQLHQPPASPSTRAREPLLEMVVVPRSMSIQAAKDALSSLALLALVVGTWPPVSPAMVRDHLRDCFSIGDNQASVRRFWPDDFIVRFSHREDLELVPGMPPQVGGPFSLRWRPWSRMIMASAGEF